MEQVTSTFYKKFSSNLGLVTEVSKQGATSEQTVDILEMIIYFIYFSIDTIRFYNDIFILVLTQ